MKIFGMMGVALGLAGCVQVESLAGADLEARLAESQLTFVNIDGPAETLVLQLREDGTGVATETKDPDEAAAVEAITWRVDGIQLCLTPPENSRIASTGREECIAVMISGDNVILGDGRDFTGTIVSL